MAKDEQDAPESNPQGGRPTTTIAIVAVVAVVILAIILFLFLGNDEPEPEPEPEVIEEPQPEVEPEPEPEPDPGPAPSPEPEQPPRPLPDLDQSDDPIMRDLEGMFGEEPAQSYIVDDELLRKGVRAASAAATDGRVVHEYRPVASPPPPLIVEPVGEARTEAEQEYRLLPRNYNRYDGYVELLTETDTVQMVEWYQRYRPLMEEAYREHGVENGSFHEVVLDVLDHLLAAPEPPEDIRLVRPKVFFEFQDEELENLPDVQKLMLRIGRDHYRAVTPVLRELRSELDQLPAELPE